MCICMRGWRYLEVRDTSDMAGSVYAWKELQRIICCGYLYVN